MSTCGWSPAASLEAMAGQMILVGFQGDAASDASIESLTAEIASSGVGGVMYLKPNIKSLAAVKAMNAAFLAAAPDGLVPFISLDQEGGSVERLTAEDGFSETPSAARIGATMTTDQARLLYADMAKGLAQLGFNLNFGPVADLNVNPDNPVIAKFGRSYGKDAMTVLGYDAAFIEAHHASGVLTSLKHFPGHGSSTKDSHEGFVDISASWDASELGPYKLLLRHAGAVDSIMVGHLYHKDYAGQGTTKLPASLSPEWIDGMLRGKMGFKGVVITDDLEMAAVRDLFPLKERILRAVRAGVDILLFSNTARPRPEIADEVRAILVAEAEADPAFKARIEQSYGRIAALKKTLVH